MKKVPLTKEQFVHYINFIKERREKIEQINELFTEEFEDSIFYPHTKYEIEMVDLLRTVFEDSDDNIGYFIYELEFGELDAAKEAIEEADGTIISLTSPEELYNYLAKEYFSE